MSAPETTMTRQRSVILEELRKIRSHPTADELYGIVRNRLPRISLGTVYRNLDFWADVGEIVRLSSAGHAMRFDGDISRHQHVRCINCGRIADIVYPLPPSVDGIQEVEGFASIFALRIEFDGVCQPCAVAG